MRSELKTKRYYRDAMNDKYVPVYYLLHNIPEPYDDVNFTESYSIVARYCDGDIRQWFYGDLERAFKVFRILSVGRHM